MHFFYIVRSLFIILLGCFVSKALQGSSPPSIIKQPDHIQYFQVATGDENLKAFTLECEATGNPEPKYTWLKNTEKFEYQPYDKRISQQPRSGTLHFIRPEAVDEGLYQCLAENIYGVSLSNSVFLRKSELFHFQQSGSIEMFAHEGKPFTIPCNPPTGYPKPSIFWMKSLDNGELFNINTSRLTVDPEGKLHFSNVTKEDAYNGKETFVCSATSMFRTEYKIGPKIILRLVTSGSSSKSSIPPELQYSSPHQVNALRGDKLELHCIFGGTPLPEITWTRKHGNLQDNRYTYINYGKTLVINNVKFEDEDDYVCLASNGGAKRETRSMQVKVLAAPYWIDAPNNTNAGDGDNIVFKCLAGGVPKPEVKWLINGKPIETVSNPRMTIRENVLSISNIVKSDTAVFQCNASNVFGYAFKDFYLNVLALPPNIIVYPQEKTRAVSMSEVILNCAVFGAPKPKVVWYKDGMELTGGNYEILDEGHLKIKQANPESSGRYKCHASNKFGEASASGALIVKRKTQIVWAPQDVRPKVGDAVKLRCTATYDMSLKPQVIWSFEGKEIDLEINQRMYVLSDNSLNIFGVTKLDAGKYTCTVKTDLDQDSKTATIIVQAPPDSPKIVSVECKDKTALLKWEPRGESDSPIEYYSIQYNTSFEPHIWYETIHDLSSHDHAFEIELSPWANYTFRVIAFNSVGGSEPSLPSKVMCSTSEDVPSNNPRNVKGEGNAPNNMIISWTPMKLVEQNAPGFFYKVYWKRKDLDNSWEMVVIKDSTVGEFKVTNTPVFKPYFIKVEAHNRKGQAPVFATQHIGYSGEDKPTQAPKNFTLVEVKDAKTAGFSWSPVSPNSLNGHFKGYKIRIRRKRGDNKDIREAVFDPNTTQAFVNIMNPFSENYVTVMAYNGMYDGPPSEELLVKTPEGTPDSVEDFDAIQMGSSALYILWSPPVKINGILRGYKISYQEIKDSSFGELIKRSPLTDPFRNSYKLSGLKPNTIYRIYLSAFTSAGDGQKRMLDKSTKPENSLIPEPPDFDFYVKEDINGSYTIRVIWKPPLDTGKSGSHFYVQYRKKGETKFIRSKDELDKEHYDLFGLDPDISYELRVISVDGNNETPSIVKLLVPKDQNIGLIAGPKDIANADWLIGILCAIALVLVLSMLVCIVKRNRGGKYSVHDRERLQRSSFIDDGGFNEYSKGAKSPKDNGSTASLTGSLKQAGNADADSMADYEDGISKFGEDGSFIGQYVPENTKDQKVESPTGVATFV